MHAQHPVNSALRRCTPLPEPAEFDALPLLRPLALVLPWAK